MQLNSNKAQYRIQRNLVTLQPGWNGELGLPMRCVPRVCGVKV